MAENEVQITPYAVGLVAASVCTNGTPEQAIEYMDDHHPTGLSHGWSRSSDGFALRDESGNFVGYHTANVMPCDQSPDTHTHYLLQC